MYEDDKRKSITAAIADTKLDPRIELGLIKKCDHLIGKRISKVGFKAEGLHIVFSVFTDDGFEFYSFLDRDKTLEI